MTTSMQSGSTTEELHCPNWDAAIVGPRIDDRGGASLTFITKSAKSVLSLLHNVTDATLTLNDLVISPDSLEEELTPLRSAAVVLDATTLGFVEVLLCCRAMRDLGVATFSILYTEPARYQRSHQSPILHKRDFELSDVVEQFSGVPGNALLLRDDVSTKGVFLLGYEGQRLEQALEQTELRPSNCSVVFGVPAFRPGWEMDAYANNVRVIRERQVSRNILFAAAQNPAAAYAAIERVYESRAEQERFIIVPIGTKPHGVGAALFACDHPDVGVLYDHPKRKQKRSEDVGTWHLYTISNPALA